jgi:hypothetical protein
MEFQVSSKANGCVPLPWGEDRESGVNPERYRLYALDVAAR